MSVATAMAAATPCLVSVGVGAGSALLPLINAEAYVLAAATRMHGPQLAIDVLAVAVGQTAGKLVLFEGARRGTAHVRKPRRSTDGRQWTERARQALASTRTGIPLVLTSAAVGLPPLAVVSIAAGAAGQRRWHFTVTCLLGRAARFAALALPMAYAID